VRVEGLSHEKVRWLAGTIDVGVSQRNGWLRFYPLGPRWRIEGGEVCIHGYYAVIHLLLREGATRVKTGFADYRCVEDLWLTKLSDIIRRVEERYGRQECGCQGFPWTPEDARVESSR
jgi:hypothetical protein